MGVVPLLAPVDLGDAVMDGGAFQQMSDPFDRIRSTRAKAMQDVRALKVKMKNANSWDHYEFLAKFFNIYASTHRMCSRILWKNGVN